ncbi:bifunctional diaminohydroxyphosphoribosylaminopyrimidine deaminase/5-amino-6-(5-phosphoribosylamino)uracil reductase RibD [Anaerotruncus sp. 80]|uniref:Riboflavin biosynthesis protein RibD n=1 Tax=Anaerotruncus colihominis TaxID=169435 RepID=A0A845QFF4_9FIRM|nr:MULTISPECIES: bifunctional diaminohydroxyphosphoribosylaminopyrimidine deaminase/5-amino-6-(5-phosphoribosylamino)uracil reductase RibD [Anaerotruncus]NBH60450.1 bifunctional diaminohydroxyphosphoribosylaminopyrimidine deaminase/5-amino-6-(5-phosphoribosylamino)uracil reductase RibD [Anaerotruncus colihominis]NCF01104.1 bifunctional diaminohydroxyphosphoribosylaminopyrimidine deaminase/5-amino-6-(5-phosphoribosylamino)uracil reductase RibD [Anaerotruncus sp. 80]
MDKKYMRLAINLAKKGAGYTAPNPLVGAVIVKNDKIIGQGFHEKYGQLHAERNALADCRSRGNDPKGASIYVTLTPCCHYGKTPPCTEAIIESGISHVIIGSRDPNPQVLDKSIELLKAAGIKVTTDFLREECDQLNPIFFHYITCHTPYVTLKYAMTMDGKIATFAGHSQWITGETARAKVHQDRHLYTAIMVGIGTVLADDPLLTSRLADGSGKNPIRIICDSSLRTPLTSKIITTASEVKTMIATAENDPARHAPYLEKGCKILVVPKDASGSIDLKILMVLLGTMKIDSILLEGGAALNWSALHAGIVNRLQAYIAPKIFGGKNALSPVAGDGAEFPSEAVKLTNSKITAIGEDLLIESEVLPCLQEL